MLVIVSSNPTEPTVNAVFVLESLSDISVPFTLVLVRALENK